MSDASVPLVSPSLTPKQSRQSKTRVFAYVKKIVSRADGRMDPRTSGRTDGRTDPYEEMRGRI